MTNANAADTVTVEPTVTAPVAKTPSKKSFADAIFAAKLVERTQGLFATNKEFRASVLSAIEKDLGVSTASAATMYNSAKKTAEAADAAVSLGRDPKKIKVAGAAGKRGRPKNATKEIVAVVEPAEAVPA